MAALQLHALSLGGPVKLVCMIFCLPSTLLHVLQKLRFLGPPFPTLSVEKVQFKAGLDLDIAGELVRTGNVNDALQYVGEPTDEMDANWEWLIRGYPSAVRRT